MNRVPPEVLAAFGFESSTVEPFGGGLINDTFSVDSTWVLQRVNPIFDPAIHESIDAVGEQLRAQGIVSPRLKPVSDATLYLLHDEQVWRALERVEGVSFNRAIDSAQLESAARFVARWHAALEDLEHEFRGQRVGVHDTVGHLKTLREALEDHEDHRLTEAVGGLAGELFDALDALPPLPLVPLRVAHGDLKLNNLLFAGAEGEAARSAHCLIDLDTMGPMLAAHELGDALRSWCNRAGEDDTEAQLDLELYRCATGAYLDASPSERRSGLAESMWLGADWISLELTARFLADALNESYFGFDAQRFATRGEHNLHRARGQWSLHLALAATRAERREMTT